SPDSWVEAAARLTKPDRVVYSAADPSQYTTRSGLVSRAASSSQLSSGVATCSPCQQTLGRKVSGAGPGAFCDTYGTQRETPRNATPRSEMDSPMPTALYEAGIHGPGWQGAMILPEPSLCYGLPPTQLGARQ